MQKDFESLVSYSITHLEYYVNAYCSNRRNQVSSLLGDNKHCDVLIWDERVSIM